MRKLELHWQILIAIILAAIVGGYVFNQQAATGVDATILGIKYLSIFEYVGTIFDEIKGRPLYLVAAAHQAGRTVSSRPQAGDGRPGSKVKSGDSAPRR